MAPKKDAKKEPAKAGDLPVQKTFAEHFSELELPSIEFSVNIRARCHPNMLEKVKVSFDWMADDLSAMNKTADGLPATLKDFTVNEAASYPGTETQVSFTKTFPAAKATLDMCNFLKAAVLELIVKVEDTECGRVPLALSPLLLAIDAPDDADPEAKQKRQDAGLPLFFPKEIFTTRGDDLHVPGLFSMELEVSTNEPVLTNEMAALLCPIFIEAKTIKNMPNERSLPDTSNGVYAYMYGNLTEKSMQVPALMEELGSKVRIPHYTPQAGTMPHDNRVKLDAKIVYFLGRIGHENLHAVREWMMNECLSVEVHDRDQKGDEVPGACDPPQEEETQEEIEATEDGGGGGSAIGASKKKKRSGKINPHGIAKFRLADLLLMNNVDITLRADLFPVRCNVKQLYKELKSEGLECATLLNRETRDKVARLASSSELREFEPPYLSYGTFVQVAVIRRAPLPDWTEIQKGVEEQWLTNLDLLEEVLPNTEDLLWQAEDPRTGVVKFRFKNASAEPPVIGSWRINNEKAQQDMFDYKKQVANQAGDEGTDESTAPPKSLETTSDVDVPNTYTTDLNATFNDKGVDLRYEKYARAIIVLDIQNGTTAKEVLRIVREVNQKAAGLEGQHVSALANYVLSPGERADGDLDIITGCCLLDKKCRMMMVEGLRKGGMRRLVEECPRPFANDEKNRMIFNLDVGYPRRQYLDFNLTPKQIKIRGTLEVLTGTNPELYDKTRVSEDMFTIIAQLREMKRAIRIDHTKKYLKCFPTSEHLVSLEILYGDYISDEELAGGISPELAAEVARIERERLEREAEEAEAGKNSTRPATSSKTETSQNEIIEDELDEEGENSTIKGETSPLRERMTRKEPLDQANPDYTEFQSMRRTMSVPNLIRTNIAKVKESSDASSRFRAMTKAPVETSSFLDPDAEVYLYSGQKYASVELQKQYMRKKMWPLQEKFMWTYSPVYNSCSFEFTDEPTGRIGLAMREDKPLEPGQKAWQYPKARPAEEFNQMQRDVTDFRKADLQTPWVENEWHGIAVGAERRMPINGKKIFDENRVPHLREHNDRPFDTNLIERRVNNFGPKSIYESVHYGGDVYEAETIERNRKKAQEEKALEIAEGVMGFYNKDYTRNAVTDLDRYDQVLKDKPKKRGVVFDQHFLPGRKNPGDRRRQQLLARNISPEVRTNNHVDSSAINIVNKYGKREILDKHLKKPPTTMRNMEEWDETAPYIEFEARMRHNDTDAPYNVRTDLYISRHTDKDLPRINPTLFTKRAFHVGKLGPAPWKHSNQTFDTTKTMSLKDPSCNMRETAYDFERKYVSNRDMDRYSQPGAQYGREDFLEKNAKRAPTSLAETTRYPNNNKFGYRSAMRELNYTGTIYDFPTRNSHKLNMRDSRSLPHLS